MPLTDSKIQINVSTCTFTPTGGSLIAITGVTGASIDLNAEKLKTSGDADFYSSGYFVVGEDPEVMINVNRVKTMLAAVPGVVGTLAFTSNDGHNGSASGGFGTVYTITNAVFEPQTLQFGHRQAATTSYRFGTFAPDGVTSPIGVAAA